MCARVCVHSIISPVGDSHKPTWNFLNKGLIFTGSCCTVKEGGPLSFSWMYLENQTLKTKLCVETSGTSPVFYCQSVVSLKQLGIITQAITSWLYSSANYFSFLKDKCLYAFDHIVNLLLWKKLHIYSLIKILLETTIQTHKPCQMQRQLKYGFYKDKYYHITIYFNICVACICLSHCVYSSYVVIWITLSFLTTNIYHFHHFCSSLQSVWTITWVMLLAWGVRIN